MSEILSIDKLKELSTPIVKIPNFDNTGTINVRLQKPKLLAMASKGNIPNHLISIANEMLTGKSSANKDKKDENTVIKEAALMAELYCRACLIEPSYEEFKDIMTDDQSDFIFQWALGAVTSLDSFRKDKEDGSSNNDGKKVSKKA